MPYPAGADPDTAAIKAVTDLIPDAGAMTSVKPRRLGATDAVVTPAQPADGLAVVSGAADVYGAWVQFVAAIGQDELLLGVFVSTSIDLTSRVYSMVNIGIGGGGAEVSQLEWPGPIQPSNSSATSAFVPFAAPLPVANGSRIAIQIADSLAATQYRISLVHIPEADYEAWDA